MTNPAKQEIIRNPDGTFPKGVSGNPEGRPKVKTIKERIRDYLDEHPERMEAIVEYFTTDSLELMWQMLEGRPPQEVKADVTSNGETIGSANLDALITKIEHELDSEGTTESS